MKNPSSTSQVRLPANRAFVVQFATDQHEAGQFNGRVEHLSSGRVVHFDSFADLQGFIAEVIEQVVAGKREP